MLEWLSQIGEYLEVFINVALMFFGSILQFFEMLPSWFIFYQASLSFLPGILVPFIILGMSVSIIFLIIGRN